MSELKPAGDVAAAVSRPYPNDDDDYRRARTALLAEEIALRRQIERVAEMRRALPPGGAIARDYDLRDVDGAVVPFSSLFGRHDTLITIFWMYGPDRARPCPMCTDRLDAIANCAANLQQRVAFAVLGRSPAARQAAFAAERGWRHFRFYQTDDDFARTYRGLADDGNEWPTLDVWSRRDGVVRHFWGEEMGGTADPGQDDREAPEISPLWNLLDLTPEGRGADWYPTLDAD